MIDWKALFSDMSVDWRDRGPNTTRHDVNICCPFCGDDYGYHMGVSLTKSAYYCFRNTEHGGRSPIFLLLALGATKSEAETLLKEYGDGEGPVAEKSAPAPASITSKWRRFLPAQDSDDCMEYLRSRGFLEPRTVAKKYDLRYSEIGRWARRIILPVKLNGEVVSWTARTIDEGRVPKYLMQSVVFPGLVYVPKASTDIMLAVEGPLDALKIVATDLPHVGAVALMGKALNSRKLIILKEYLAPARKAIFVPDSDVDMVSTSRMQAVLATTRMFRSPLQLRRVPAPYKDAGAMPLYEIRKWLAAA